MALPLLRPRRLLDRLDSRPVAAWGVRQLSNEYTGPLFTGLRSDGQTVQVTADWRGYIDRAQTVAFAGGRSLDVTVAHDLTGQGRDMAFGAGNRAALLRRGFESTISDLPAVTATGTSRGSANIPFRWSQPLVISGVIAVTTVPPASNAYIAGVDTASSVYRDCQLFIAKGSNVLGLGEDMTTLTPAAQPGLTADTVQIVTAIRNPNTSAARGYLRVNGQTIGTFTGGSQSTTLTPGQFVTFGDPDDASAFCPSGYAWQELIVWNGDAPPSAAAIAEVERDQGEFFNIPLYGTLAWPVQVSRKVVAFNGSQITTNSGLPINFSYR